MHTTTILGFIPPEEPLNASSGAILATASRKDKSNVDEVQLQNVLALYREVVQTEEDAINILYTVIKEEGLTCSCGSEHLEQVSGTRKYICIDCQKFAYFTAGTIFQGVSRLVAWIGGLVLFSQGFRVTANRLSRLFCVAPATASNLHSNIEFIMSGTSKAENSSRLISNLVETILHRQEQQAINTSTENLTEEQYKVWNACSENRSSVDELIDTTRLPTGIVLSALTELELMNFLERLSDYWYRKRGATVQPT